MIHQSKNSFFEETILVLVFYENRERGLFLFHKYRKKRILYYRIITLDGSNPDLQEMYRSWFCGHRSDILICRFQHFFIEDKIRPPQAFLKQMQRSSAGKACLFIHVLCRGVG